MTRLIALLSTMIILLYGCIEITNSFPKLPPGQWRGILKISDAEMNTGGAIDYDESKKIIDYFELPFNFEVTYENDIMCAYLINGEERIKVEDLHFGKDISTAKDTIQFDFTSFDTRIDGFYEENFIEGYWKVPYKGKYSIPFKAIYGQNHRFNIPPNTEAYDFDGDWDVTFEFDNPEDQYPAVGSFKQNGNSLSGTFKTETGDYRFLDGNAYGNKMKLSVFDGAHAFLFSGNVSNDTIYGEFRSGNHYKSNWIAVKKDKEKNTLKDPYSMTMATTTEAIDFSFPSSEGEIVKLSDSTFDGKIKLINIMGTWCPNCRDEIDFLINIKAENPNVEVISIAFERYKEEAKCIEQIKKYKQKLGFDWDILYGGYASKKLTGETLEFVDKIYSYPTLILVGKDNRIIDIHTGFYGPATSDFSVFKKEYLEKINKLTS